MKWTQVKVAQLCPTLCDPMDYTVHEILQARILEWVAFPFSRGSSQPRDQTRFPALQADSLPAEPQGKPHLKNTHPLKQPWDTTTHLLEWLTWETLTAANAGEDVRMCRSENSRSLLMGVQNGMATLEDRLVVPYKTKHNS